jgi:hypothetical protein
MQSIEVRVAFKSLFQLEKDRLRFFDPSIWRWLAASAGGLNIRRSCVCRSTMRMPPALSTFEQRFLNTCGVMVYLACSMLQAFKPLHASAAAY